jgi:hypothetical protein
MITLFNTNVGRHTNLFRNKLEPISLVCIYQSKTKELKKSEILYELNDNKGLKITTMYLPNAKALIYQTMRQPT